MLAGNEAGARAVVHALTDLQLEEAEKAVSEAIQKMTSSGAQEVLSENTRKKAEGMMSPEQAEAYRDFMAAEAYRAFVFKRRESKSISATLKEAQPVLEIQPGMLDKDWFLLCAPNGTYDLRKGLDGLREHSPDDFITKMTAYAPSDKGMEIWLDALNTFFCGDQSLIQYVQRVAGIVCVGQVFQEAMIIAYGDGRNGKSTFWNTLSRVMGSYSGNISADTLTMNCKRNVKPEMAETKGKRIMIAAELEEGTRLNTSMVKQLTSTDPVFAEKKYKDPFSFCSQPYAGALYQSPSQGGCKGHRYLAPTDRYPVQGKDRGKQRYQELHRVPLRKRWRSHYEMDDRGRAAGNRPGFQISVPQVCLRCHCSL